MADVIRQLREQMLASKVSRYQLAQLTGLDQGALSRFAHEQSALTIESAGKLAKALGLELRLMPAATKTPTTTTRTTKKTAHQRGGA